MVVVVVVVIVVVVVVAIVWVVPWFLPVRVNPVCSQRRLFESTPSSPQMQPLRQSRGYMYTDRQTHRHRHTEEDTEYGSPWFLLVRASCVAATDHSNRPPMSPPRMRVINMSLISIQVVVIFVLVLAVPWFLLVRAWCVAREACSNRTLSRRRGFTLLV